MWFEAAMARYKQYSTLIPKGAFSERELQMLKRIEELEALAKLRAERMEVIRDYMTQHFDDYAVSCWSDFVRSYNEIENWFDKDGKAK